MITDALDGKIDLIVTKSVSRFARNTVDSLVTIRKLKENGVECYFEKEGIYTFDGKDELLITIMSSLAQEESRSISENITWGQRKSFSDGKVHLPYKRFLGYEKGEDGRPAVVESEARVVKLIYNKTSCYFFFRWSHYSVSRPAYNKQKKLRDKSLITEPQSVKIIIRFAKMIKSELETGERC